MTTAASVMTWKPTPEAKSLSGKALPAERDFFVSPPTEVGRVSAAWTDVRAGQTLWSFPIKLALAVACGLVAIGVMGWTAKQMQPGQKPDLLHVVGVIVPLCGAILALAFAFKKKWIVYVGDTGAAYYTTRGTRDDATGEAVRFTEVADVQVVVTGQHKGKIDFKATFTAADGTVLMRFRGGVQRAGGKTLFNTAHAFAVAAHNAWEAQTS